MQSLIDRVGAERIPYISFEMNVNMAGGQPFSMENAKKVSELCYKYGIKIFYDATRCVENAYFIKQRENGYQDKKTGDHKYPKLELVRVTIPRRVYTNLHMDVVAESVAEVYSYRDNLKGLKMVYEPAQLRFFTARFELL
ncbi:Tyrosine phenol-lyase [subsurface metagenome]